MTTPSWEDTDRYIVDTLIGTDEALSDALSANAEGGLPAIDVSPAQGKFLNLLARSIGASRVLEIGTLGGYSTIWLARAVGKSGHVVTLEYRPEHAAVARANLKHARVSKRVEILVGRALDSLPDLESGDPFDLVFIDADKENNSKYVNWALRLTRPGSVIVVDNVVRAGMVAQPDNVEPMAKASRDLVELLAAEPRLDATVVQTVGAKGWDGFAYALVVK